MKLYDDSKKWYNYYIFLWSAAFCVDDSEDNSEYKDIGNVQKEMEEMKNKKLTIVNKYNKKGK